MSNNKHPFDSFLSTGAIDLPSRIFNSSGSGISPLSVPRSIPETIFIPSTHSSTRSSTSPNAIMQSRSSSHHPNSSPISPPKTRSASADDRKGSLNESWRLYAQNLRSQFEGEKAHMVADRARMEECIAEERLLWDQERDLLLARIKRLESSAVSGSREGSGSYNPQTMAYRPAMMNGSHTLSLTSPGSNGVSSGSLDNRAVPQESGRNADGTPFYAPAPINPSRTFSPSSDTSELRVDSIIAPRESAIRVTSKQLSSSDFVIQSSSNNPELESVAEAPKESIDISHIQPELEGVQIKASAVSPSFAARVLSPNATTPAKLSPISVPSRILGESGSPPGRRSKSPEEKAIEKEQKTFEVAVQPENRRLTMHAGHTPNHSMASFAFLAGKAPKGGEESGNATPTQEHHEEPAEPSLGSDGISDERVDDNGDYELTGPLGLTNQPVTDDLFIAQLVSKLEEAQRSESVSPSSESGSSGLGEPQSSRRRVPHDDDAVDDGPPLRLKPSFNFGRPMGKM